MTVEQRTANESAISHRGLGICWLAYGLWRLAAAAGLLVFSATATLMFGALLNRVADPFTLMSVFHVLYAIAIVLLAVSGVVGFLAGLALMSSARSGRQLGILAAVLSLWGIPVGTTLGIYTLIVLLPMAGPRREVTAQNVPLPPLNRRAITT